LWVERTLTVTCTYTHATPGSSIRSATRGGRPALAVLETLRPAMTGRASANAGAAPHSTTSAATTDTAAKRAELMLWLSAEALPAAGLRGELHVRPTRLLLLEFLHQRLVSQ
jgi:hypothetical protein